MLSFITDENNDLMLNALGNIRMEEGLEAYRQQLINTIRLQQFEYPYNPSSGLNYMGYILGERPNIVAWESQLFELVSSMPFVKNIVDWQYSIQNNIFLFRLVVNTDLGEIELKG